MQLLKNHNPSLVGKEIIDKHTNGFAFICKLSCLDSPNDAHYKKFKAMVRGSIWDGKASKIAYNTLTSSYTTWGFKLMDLEKKKIGYKISMDKKVQFLKK